MTALKQMLLSGGLLRIGKPYGAHIVNGGRVLPVDAEDVEKALKTGLVRPNGRDQFGRYMFVMCTHA